MKVNLAIKIQLEKPDEMGGEEQRSEMLNELKRVVKAHFNKYDVPLENITGHAEIRSVANMSMEDLPPEIQAKLTQIIEEISNRMSEDGIDVILQGVNHVDREKDKKLN